MNLFKKKIELPEFFSPYDVKKERKLCYFIGIYNNIEFKVRTGPFLILKPALMTIGNKNDCIVRFNSDYTEDLLYSWDEDRRGWTIAKDVK